MILNANKVIIQTLHIECQMIFLETIIVSSLRLEQANTKECLEALDEISQLKITSLMLKKYPHVVENINRVTIF